MKRRTALLTGIAGALVFAGCSPSTDNGNGGESSGTQYVAFSKKVSPRMDFLFKTEASPSSTEPVSDLMIPHNQTNLHFETLSIVKEYGDMVYSKSLIYKDSDGSLPLPEYHTKFYQTNKNNDQTIALEWAADSRLYEIGNTLYRVAGNRAKIDKIGTNGTVIGAAEYLDGVDPISPFGSVEFNGKIIIAVQGMTLRYDPGNDSFIKLTGLDELEIIEMVKGDDDRLYFFGKLPGETEYSLFIYNLASPATPPTRIAHYTSGVVKPGSMMHHDGRLYFVAQKGSHYGAFMYRSGWDEPVSIDGVNLNLLGVKAHFVPFDGDLYLPYENKLYKIDPDTHQASVAIGFIGDNSVYPIDNTLYYAGKDTAHGIELWKYTGGQSTLVRDINPGTGDSHPLHVIKLNGKLLFQAAADGIHNDLYSLDGTTLTALTH